MNDWPSALVEYHRSGRRLEGDLGEALPGWFRLWPLAEIAELNRAYEVAENAPGYTGVGSNGSGEMIALSPSHQVVVLPFVGMKAEDAIVVAESWEAFESRIESCRA